MRQDVLFIGCPRSPGLCFCSFLLGQEHCVVGQRRSARHRSQCSSCHRSVVGSVGIFTQKSDAFFAIHHREDTLVQLEKDDTESRVHKAAKRWEGMKGWSHHSDRWLDGCAFASKDDHAAPPGKW
jgi:hypothetical protein